MLKRKKKIIAKVMATTMLATTLASAYTVNADALESRASVSTSTLAGNNRYETAIKVSEDGWSTSTNAVLINGEAGLVDALTATPYANLKNAPILITHKDKLTPATKARLTKMNVKNVDIVGGSSVVSEKVVSELKAMKITVNRIYGANRYETATAVAKAMDKISDVSKIAVVNGKTGLPDAVSVAAPAADNKMPILLADPKSGLNDSAKKFVSEESISKSYVIGQTAAVSNTIMNSLPGTKQRLGGSTRQETNAKVIEAFYTSKSLGNVYVAKSGQVNKEDELVDALAVGVLAAKKDYPVVIVGKNLHSSQSNLLKNKEFTKITQVGSGVPSSSINAIKDTQEDPEARVTSVSMVNYKTIKISGSELNRLNASNISISGNSVRSYSANSSGSEATVEFNNAFANGTNTVRITSNLGNTTSYNFTYSAEISSVEASTTEIGTGANNAIQYLELTVNNGQKRTVEELKALGWTVEFKANNAVFYKDASTAQNTSSTGKLRTNQAFVVNNDNFNYEVTLTKGSQKLSSKLQAVKIVDRSAEYKEIKSHKLKLGNTILNSSKMVIGETIGITDLEVVDLDNNKKTVTISGFTVESNRPQIVSIDNNNNLRAISKGTAEITISNGTISRKFSVTVEDQAREETTLQLENSTDRTVKLIADVSASKVVRLIVKDQYGDPHKSDNLDNFITVDSKVTVSGSDIATIKAKPLKSDAEGKTSIEIQPTANPGSGDIIIKKGNTNSELCRITISTSTDSTLSKYKFEVPNGKDRNLDLYKDDDKSITLTLNRFNAADYLIGKDNTASIPVIEKTSDVSVNAPIQILSTDKSKAVVTLAENGDILITGKAIGSTNIEIYKSGVRTDVVTITIEDTTPKITSIKTNSIYTVDKVGDFDIVKELLDVTEVSSGKFVVRGVTMSGTAEEVLLGNDGTRPVLYVEKNKTLGYADGDLLIATIDIVNPFGLDATEDGELTFVAGNKGSVVVSIFNGAYLSSNPFKVETINVNIPN